MVKDEGLLVVIDQPTGIDRSIWDESEWLCKDPPPGARVLLLSSPVE